MSKFNPHNPRTITGLGIDAKSAGSTSTDIIPAVDLIYSLGSSIYRWKEIYAGSGIFETSVTCSGIIQATTLVGVEVNATLSTSQRMLAMSTNTAGNRNDMDAACYVRGGIACNENVWAKTINSDIDINTLTVNATNVNATTVTTTNSTTTSSSTTVNLTFTNGTGSNATISKITNNTLGNPTSHIDSTCPTYFAGGVAVGGLLFVDSITVNNNITVPSLTTSSLVLPDKLQFGYGKKTIVNMTITPGAFVVVTGTNLKAGLLEVSASSTGTASVIQLIDGPTIITQCNNESDIWFEIIFRNQSAYRQPLVFGNLSYNLLSGETIYLKIFVSSASGNPVRVSLVPSGRLGYDIPAVSTITFVNPTFISAVLTTTQVRRGLFKISSTSDAGTIILPSGSILANDITTSSDIAFSFFIVNGSTFTQTLLGFSAAAINLLPSVTAYVTVFCPSPSYTKEISYQLLESV